MQVSGINKNNEINNYNNDDDDDDHNNNNNNNNNISRSALQLLQYCLLEHLLITILKKVMRTPRTRIILCLL